jgi:hypothetical protein
VKESHTSTRRFDRVVEHYGLRSKMTFRSRTFERRAVS